jgi:hypothetical protein
MGSGEVKSWEPKEPAVLRGVFDFFESLNWAVRTTDGTVWLLETEAEDQLRALRPKEGQEVQVMYIYDSLGEPTYHVSLH